MDSRSAATTLRLAMVGASNLAHLVPPGADGNRDPHASTYCEQEIDWSRAVPTGARVCSKCLRYTEGWGEGHGSPYVSYDGYVLEQARW